MRDQWLEQLRQLHDADKAEREAQKPKKPEKTPEMRAAELLQKSGVHQLLRQVQKVLLNGGGTLDILDRSKDYDGGVTLAWQGPISEARKPEINDSEPYNYIIVGVKNDAIWVNGKRLANIQPDTIKSALLDACKNPKREKRGKK